MPKPKPIRFQIAKWIVDQEARRDPKGNIKMYHLPPADGGGTLEYAGINDRYHPDALRKISTFLKAGKNQSAEQHAIEYIAKYTDVVKEWTKLPWLEAFLRDCAFNRGPKGALRILQLAAGVADDGKYGPKTQAAIESRSRYPDRFLDGLRSSRELYERRIAPPVGARGKFWQGLVNRWDNCLAFANTFLT